jgi:hypothetical protein
MLYCTVHNILYVLYYVFHCMTICDCLPTCLLATSYLRQGALLIYVPSNPRSFGHQKGILVNHVPGSRIGLCCIRQICNQRCAEKNAQVWVVGDGAVKREESFASYKKKILAALNKRMA